MAKKFDLLEVEEKIANMRATRWEEMSPSQLRLEFKTLKADVGELFTSPREKNMVLEALEAYIDEVSEGPVNYDPNQND